MGLFSDDDKEGNEIWSVDQFALNSSLCHLEKILTRVNMTLTEFGLPTPDTEKEEFVKKALADEYVADDEEMTPQKAKIFFEANYPKLNAGQKEVFRYVTKLIAENNNDGMLMFLDAPGGTGKTFTLNVMINWILMNELKVATSATSWIAATLLILG